MGGGHAFAGEEGENVVVTPGDVTSISSASGDEPLAAGGAAIAASLSADHDLLNIAFVTGGGDVQIVQIGLADLTQGDGSGGEDGVVVAAELTALSGDVIRSGGGAATPVGTIAVAATLGAQGDLSLSFADGNGDMQLIETNVAEVLQGLNAADGASAAPAQPGRADRHL